MPATESSGNVSGGDRAKVATLELEMRRFLETEDSTISVLSIDGTHECFVLEDQTRAPGEKVYGKTAIPAGRYRVILTHSPRFKRYLPRLVSVPMFEGILIHAGNDAGDTEGCLLPGVSWSAVNDHGFVYQSRVALAPLQAQIERAINVGKTVWITIIDASKG